MESELKLISQIIINVTYETADEVKNFTLVPLPGDTKSKKTVTKIDNSIGVEFSASFSKNFHIMRLTVKLSVNQSRDGQDLSETKIETLSIFDVSSFRLKRENEIKQFLEDNMESIQNSVYPFTQRIANYILGRTNMKVAFPKKINAVQENELT